MTGSAARSDDHDVGGPAGMTVSGPSGAGPPSVGAEPPSLDPPSAGADPPSAGADPSSGADPSIVGTEPPGPDPPGAGAEPSAAFDAWLHDTLSETDPDERSRRLADWASAPGARRSHPREDHLIPLMVAVGAAETDSATQVHHEDDAMGGGIHVSSYAFGLAA